VTSIICVAVSAAIGDSAAAIQKPKKAFSLLIGPSQNYTDYWYCVHIILIVPSVMIASGHRSYRIPTTHPETAGTELYNILTILRSPNTAELTVKLCSDLF